MEAVTRWAAGRFVTCFTYYNPGRTLQMLQAGQLLGVKNFLPGWDFSNFNYTYYRDRTNDGTHTNNNN